MTSLAFVSTLKEMHSIAVVTGLVRGGILRSAVGARGVLPALTRSGQERGAQVI